LTMRRFIALALALTLSSLFSPLVLSARAAGQAGASLSGTATTSTGTPIPNATVQLRNLASGQLMGSTTSSAVGAFNFTGLPSGNFAVEIVSAAGQIIGTSAAIAVAAGASVTGVTVAATAVATAGGAAAAGAAVATGTGVSTAIIIAIAAAAAAVVAVVVVVASASPSR